MKRWICPLLLLFLFLICPQASSADDPGAAPLPSELVELHTKGGLTVRALWGWRLVPEATPKMALEFRALGYDLLAADKLQLTAWLQQAEAGQLQLTAQQKEILVLLSERMTSVEKSAEGSAGQVAVGGNPPALDTPDTLAGTSVSAAAGEGETDASFTGTTRDLQDTAQLVADLEKQVEAGNSRSMLLLALVSKTTAAGPPDPYRALRLLEDAAAAGEPDALAALADEYASGLWIKQDLEKANQLRQQAAAKGSQSAQWEME